MTDTQRETEHALLAAERELRDIKFALDQASIVAVTDHKGVITWVNDTFCTISKYPREALIDQDHRILNSDYHPKSYIRDLWRTIAQGKVWRGELRNRAADGSHYWVDTTIVPFLNDAGKPYQYLSIRNDITERKRVQEQLLQRQTMAQLGQMAAVIAHEVKNPLAGISGAIQVIERRLGDTQEARILRDIQARVASLNDSLKALLDFARPRPPRPSPVDLRGVVERTLMLIEQDPDHSGTTIQLDGPETTVLADAEQISRVVLNLILNAVHASGPDGHVHIVIEPRDDTVRLSVVDDGPGFDPATSPAAAFEPFFTTKVNGTGLGLCVVKQTIDAHQGAVDACNAPGGGARVSFTLPRPPSA